MIEIIPVTGCLGSECFLLLSESGAFLVDTGCGFCAEDMAQNLARALGGRSLDCILLTHSHFDHVGGLPVVRRAWPGAKVVSGRHVKDILARDGAKRTMRLWDDAAAAKCGKAPVREGHYTEDFTPDMTAAEGDVLRICGASILVTETPGHTKCSVSYYFQEEDLLVLSETTGVKLIGGGEVIPAFIVGYRDALKAIARAEEIAPQRILIPHFGPMRGDAATAYLREARTAAESTADFILEGHKKGRSFEELLDDCVEKFYIDAERQFQPKEAFLSNMSAMIPRLIAEMDGGR
ncbi:MAG: MBL fold metallo-hydrolase [Clostridiales Family XIII bacterium]|jgi:glyoxylase-like metal-dependent hydrolase (beta-lactamase superfamily II)|nr:MBL fold metallo-hydrolase [Clostridiales Family XIII bacterium]